MDRLALERMRTMDVVRLAAAVETDSEHPLARAIVAAAAAAEVGDVLVASDFVALSGRGVEAVVGGHRVAVGGPSMLRERTVDIPEQLATTTQAWEERGAAVLHVIRDGEVIGALALEDEIRAESRAAVDRLHQLGVRVAMITGDSNAIAQAVGLTLGIDEVHSRSPR